jgi:hypothetical protein
LPSVKCGAAALSVAALLVGAACSSEPEEPVTVPAPSPAPDPVCPLTGAEIPKGIDVSRPAVAIKVENSPQARPQSGLEDADIVYEEIVEGGITRFMAIYHCKDSKKVGPVRSARFDDPKIAKPYTRILAFSGGNSIVERELVRQHLIPLQENDGGGSLYRVPPGVLELHNLYGDTSKIRGLRVSKKARGPKSDLFEFGPQPDQAKKARRITVRFKEGNSIEYRWKKGKWARFEAGSPFRTKTGGRIAVPNVLIQQVVVNNSRKITDSAGNPSPDIRLEGKGRALLFRDGTVQKGIWKIDKKENSPTYTRANGDPFVFATGPIWIELVPSRKGSVKGFFAFR